MMRIPEERLFWQRVRVNDCRKHGLSFRYSYFTIRKGLNFSDIEVQ